MNNTKVHIRPQVLIALIFVAALSRLLPHPYNFSPIGGIALFGAAYFSRKWMALIIPVAAIWFSSLLLDNLIYAQYYEGFVWFSNPAVYIGFAAVVFLGWGLLKKVSVGSVLLGAIGGSVLFFLISNLGVWAFSPLYAKSLDGLLTCYAAAIPFFQNTLAGDMVYAGLLFGSFEWLRTKQPALVLKNA